MSSQPDPNDIRNVTIMDVARESGVSYSTVSRVLNGYEFVKDSTRQRVLETAERLGYVANLQARSLAGGRSRIIGLLVPGLDNAYIGEVVRGIDEELARANYDLMLYTTHRHRGKEPVYVKTIVNGIVDGLLLIVPLDPVAYLKNLRERQFPYVVIDHQGFDDFSPTVVATNWQGAYDATSYLIQLGHRRIGFVAGTPELSSATERLNAYQAALYTHEISFDAALVQNGDFQQEGGYLAAKILLNLDVPPTAIFASNDSSALGVYDAVHEFGLRIPHDISVVGFDDTLQAAVMYPPLTTVRQPLMDMGRTATRMLLNLIKGQPPPNHRIVLPTNLVLRGSCQAPATTSVQSTAQLSERRMK